MSAGAMMTRPRGFSRVTLSSYSIKPDSEPPSLPGTNIPSDVEIICFVMYIP